MVSFPSLAAYLCSLALLFTTINSSSLKANPNYYVPVVPLKNAAVAGLIMPAMGLGTGGYGSTPVGGNCSAYPECWNEAGGCGTNVATAVSTWLTYNYHQNMNLIRIDNANTYADVGSVGMGIIQSGVPRKNIFLLSKVGSGQAMGYQDTLNQFQSILTTQNVTYVDALLIHWPTSTGNSTDTACQMSQPTYNATQCRLNTWKAMVEIYESGAALSIGVSNYNKSEILEISNAGMILPAINQIPIHIYRSSSQMETIEFCQQNNIQVNAYSPLGVPDWHVFPASGGMSTTPLVDPVVTNIASTHNRSPAAVLINWLWQQYIVTNPRTYSLAHMIDNLSAYNFTLTDAEVALLSSRPQVWCSLDPTFYECAPDNIGPSVSHPWSL